MCCKQCHLEKSGHFSDLIFELLRIWKFSLTKLFKNSMSNYLRKSRDLDFLKIRTVAICRGGIWNSTLQRSPNLGLWAFSSKLLRASSEMLTFFIKNDGKPMESWNLCWNIGTVHGKIDRISENELSLTNRPKCLKHLGVVRKIFRNMLNSKSISNAPGWKNHWKIHAQIVEHITIEKVNFCRYV